MANVSDPALRQWAEDLKDDHNECAAQPSLKLAAMSADPPSPLSTLLAAPKSADLCSRGAARAG